MLSDKLVVINSAENMLHSGSFLWVCFNGHILTVNRRVMSL